MTIDRHRGKLFCMCDICGQEFQNNKGDVRYYETDEFDVLVSDIKDEGWKANQIAPKVWEHYCSDCQ